MSEKIPFSTQLSKLFFAVCILFVLFLAYLLVKPYLVPIFLAVVLTVVSQPLYEAILRILTGHNEDRKTQSWRRNVASGLTCVLIILIIIVPFFLIAGVITNQALDLYNTVSIMLHEGRLGLIFQKGMEWFEPIQVLIHDNLGVSQDDVVQNAGELVRSMSTWLYDNFTGVLRGVTGVVISFALIMFVAFYLFTDGSRMGERILSLSPLHSDMNQQISRDIISSIRVTLRGTVLLAFLLGFLNGLGFWIAGVPNALFWGTVMIFASVVPIVGAALIWVPAFIYLIAVQDYHGAILIFIWCMGAGLICDNILRPKLFGGSKGIHPLLTFFSVLGGLSLFGIVGLILGPLVLAVLLSLLDVYERYFLEPEAAVLNQAVDPPEGA